MRNLRHGAGLRFSSEHSAGLKKRGALSVTSQPYPAGVRLTLSPPASRWPLASSGDIRALYKYCAWDVPAPSSQPRRAFCLT